MHELVLPYRLGEIRLQSEHAVQKPGLTASADLLVQISRKEVPTAVTSDGDACDRIYAFSVVLEYVGLTYARASSNNGIFTGGSFHDANPVGFNNSSFWWMKSSEEQHTTSPLRTV